MSPITQDPLLTDTEAAAYLNVRPHTLAVWRSTGRYRLPYVEMWKTDPLQKVRPRRLHSSSHDGRWWRRGI